MLPCSRVSLYHLLLSKQVFIVYTSLMEKDYSLLQLQWDALFEDETNPLAIYSNTSALIKEFYQDEVNWSGFYFMDGTTLVLGPFQGKVACMHLYEGKGVCQKAVSCKGPFIVDNVHTLADHIACDAASKSEIVIPLIKDDKVIGVLDIDSPEFRTFSFRDAEALNEICQKIVNKL